MPQQNWTETETLVAHLMLKLPRLQLRDDNKQLIQTARELSRTTTALRLKIGNLYSKLPANDRDGRVGLAHLSRLDEEIMRKYVRDPTHMIGLAAQAVSKINRSLLPPELPNLELVGEAETARYTSVRTKQHLFRERLLATYGRKFMRGTDAHPDRRKKLGSWTE